MAGDRRPEGGFTDRVRQELSRLPLGEPPEQRAELAALLRFAGALHLSGREGGEVRLAVEVDTASGAVARRTYALLQASFDLRPELRVVAAGGVRPTTYGVVVGPDSAPAVVLDLGLLDPSGRPAADLPADLRGDSATAFLRGSLLAAGSLSAPGRNPHLEIAVRRRRAADQLADIVRRVVDSTVGVGETPAGHRVVLKSGAAIGELLATVGATTAFLTWDEHRLRRQLRNEAQRLANADAANVRRAVEAASAQGETVERAIAEVGWEGLDDDLREVALARLANPAASLSELGELCDPPLGKSAVFRRLKRLEELAEPPAER